MPLATVLTKAEERIFNLPPKFNYSEQRYFFTLPKSLNEKVMSYDDSNKIIFVMMYGCFKATHRFYTVEEYIKANYSFIEKNHNLTNGIDISKSRFYNYQQIIKEYLGIREYSEELQQQLQIEANNLASNFIHRKKLFYSLVDLAKKIKIEVPSYTELTRIITNALHNQKSTILEKLEEFVNDSSIKELNELLKKDGSYKNQHYIAQYKKLEHSTKKKQISQSLIKFDSVKQKFLITKL